MSKKDGQQNSSRVPQFSVEPGENDDDSGPGSPCSPTGQQNFNRSFIITGSRPYQPFANDTMDTANGPSLGPLVPELKSTKEEEGTKKLGRIKALLAGRAFSSPMANDPAKNYTFFLSPHEEEQSEEGSPECDPPSKSIVRSKDPANPLNDVWKPSLATYPRVQAEGLKGSTGGLASNTSIEHKPTPPDKYGHEFSFLYEDGCHAIPDIAAVHSRCDLEDDSVGLAAVWQGLNSEVVATNIFFALRVTLFSVTPAFVLSVHPTTASWFPMGALMPVIAGLCARPTVGAEMMMTTINIQTGMVVMCWGVLMNAVGATNNSSGWWCAVVFGPFVFSLFGNVASKRMIMMYLIIIMQLENVSGGTSLVFPLLFARDLIFASGFALAACILPSPSLARNQADDTMLSLHKLCTAALGNAIKSYWAPVNVDAKAALSQIPFVKMRDVMVALKTLISQVSYEPSEFDLTNTLREERVDFLAKLKVHLYSMYAISSQRSYEGQVFKVPKHFKDFEGRIQEPFMNLAKVLIEILPQLGKSVNPTDVINNVNFADLATATRALQDVTEYERAQIFFPKLEFGDKASGYLRTFAFSHQLIKFATDILLLEVRMRSFDPNKYPSTFRRGFNFFFYDNWQSFWEELPKRLTLATPRDVRILKDSIKYALAFATSCAFTLYIDQENVYFFGMAILIRLAQQTASETLAIGIYRICGLCIGASLAYITRTKTRNLTEETLLTMTFVFLALCLSQHAVYGAAAQYVVVVSMTALKLVPQPALLLTRMTDNVFAFISYFMICTVIFPLDPIRVLWNTRTKLFISINSGVQTFVAIGCAPITQGGLEGQFFIPQLMQTVKDQRMCLAEYGNWMKKCISEPTIRGGEYPQGNVLNLFLSLTELCSLQESMLGSIADLHRSRSVPPSVIVTDIMELLRPFLLDAGKIVQRFFQNLVDATERPHTWSHEEALNTLWKAELASRSLKRLTTNIQRNFFAAVLQTSSAHRRHLNAYVPVAVTEPAFQDSTYFSATPSNDEDMQRLLAISFQLSSATVFPEEDMTGFSAIVNLFDLLLERMSCLLPEMVEIHAYETTRVSK